MSKPSAFPGLAQFVAATAGRNMTRAAFVAIAIGVAMVMLASMDPAYQAAHRWIAAVLWGCLGFFTFEWGAREVKIFDPVAAYWRRPFGESLARSTRCPDSATSSTPAARQRHRCTCLLIRLACERAGSTDQEREILRKSLKSR
ncbi:MAG: hypothetical protein ACRECL_04750, partial [Bradyrhizobium sp.]